MTITLVFMAKTAKQENIDQSSTVPEKARNHTTCTDVA